MSHQPAPSLPDTINLGPTGITMTFLRDHPFLTRVHVPASSPPLTVPPHWHAAHAEVHRVLQGRVEYTLDGVRRSVGPADGEVYIACGVVHALRSVPGAACVVEERTEPMDEEKELTFRNMFARGTTAGALAAMQVFYHGDAYPALGLGKWFDRLCVAVLGGWLAPLLGYRRAYESVKRV